MDTEHGFEGLMRAVNAVQMHAPRTYDVGDDGATVVVSYFPDTYEYLLAFAGADGIEMDFEFVTPAELIERMREGGWTCTSS